MSKKIMQGGQIDSSSLIEEVLMPLRVGVIEQITLHVPNTLSGRIIVSLNGVNTIINTLVSNDKKGYYPHVTFYPNVVISTPSDLVCYFYPYKAKGKEKISITYLQSVA